ncbi:MAG: hypothetical protein WC796_03095 [Candidatus Pacearchaeota archaeon]|jgi:hypothetical protein
MNLEEKTINLMSKGLTLSLVGFVGFCFSEFQHFKLNQRQEVIRQVSTQNPQCVIEVPRYGGERRDLNYILYGSAAISILGFGLYYTGDILEEKNKNKGKNPLKKI